MAYQLVPHRGMTRGSCAAASRCGFNVRQYSHSAGACDSQRRGSRRQGRGAVRIGISRGGDEGHACSGMRTMSLAGHSLPLMRGGQQTHQRLVALRCAWLTPKIRLDNAIR